MISWISKYRLSTALDAKKNGRSPAASESLADFTAELASVDVMLKKHAGAAAERPVYFHGSIMRAVRAVADSASPLPSGKVRWAPALGLSAVAVAGLLWVLSTRTPPPVLNPSVLDSASSALVLGDELARDASSLAQPMTDEWERVHLDLQRTADFLLSSLP